LAVTTSLFKFFSSFGRRDGVATATPDDVRRDDDDDDDERSRGVAGTI
jgi:hypothetical protein